MWGGARSRRSRGRRTCRSPAGGLEITGELDPNDPVRSDVNVFNRVHLSFRLAGVTEEQGAFLVDRFKKR